MIYNEYLKLFSMQTANKQQTYEHFESHVENSPEPDEYVYWTIANSEIFDEVFYTIELSEKYYQETNDYRMLLINCSLREEFMGGFDEITAENLYKLLENKHVTDELAGNIWLLLADFLKDNEQEFLNAVQKSLSYFKSPKAYWLLGEHEKKNGNDLASIEYLKMAVKSVTKIFSTIQYNSAETCHDFFTFEWFCNKNINLRYSDPIQYYRLFAKAYKME